MRKVRDASPEVDSACLKPVVLDHDIDVVYPRVECYSSDAAFWVWYEIDQGFELGRTEYSSVLYYQGGARKECRPEVRAKSCASARELEEVWNGGVAPTSTT